MDLGISEVVVVVASDDDIDESTTSEMVVVGVGTFGEEVGDTDKCVNLASKDESGEIKVDISSEEDSSLVDLDDVALVEDVVVDDTVVAIGDDTAEDVIDESDSKPVVDIVIDEFEEVSIDPEDVTNWCMVVDNPASDTFEGLVDSGSVMVASVVVSTYS